MGLKIHSISKLPEEVIRGYYVYLLDYGWEEPLGRALRDNFDKMAGLASHNDAAVLLGLNGSEFNDEVLSWHGVNGKDADTVCRRECNNVPKMGMKSVPPLKVKSW